MRQAICISLIVTLLTAPSLGGDDPAPESARAKWIAQRIERLTSSADERDDAILELIDSDKKGDCTNALIAVLPEHKKNAPVLVAVIRALGRDRLWAAAIPITEFLRHKEASVRGNAAVSLEYIGRQKKPVHTAIRKAVMKERDEAVANHMYRALGRCSVGDSASRALLLKKASRAKTEFATYGPSIGLAYWRGDVKAARGVQKILRLIGVPGSRRGGGTNTVKRGLISWTLASIGDEKSAKFMDEEMIAKLEHVKAPWVGGLATFWDNVARVCEGDDDLMPGVEQGVRGFVQYAKRADLGRYGAETRSLMDDCRTGREPAGFTPTGDNLLHTEDE